MSIETEAVTTPPQSAPVETVAASPEATAETAPSATATVAPYTLYVGNLFYKTKKQEIQELFAEHGVQTVQIPMRRNETADGRFVARPRGFAFVTFKPEADLEKVIEEFNGKEFLGRTIYVMLPKPTEPREKKDNIAKDSQEDGAEEGENTKTTDEAKEVKKTTKKSKKSKKKEVKERIPFELATKSTDTLHVKNLDFGIRSQDLKEFFAAEGEDVEWVSVPFLNLPAYLVKKLQEKGKSVERRNRGYAFVTFKLKEGETIEDKVEKFNGKMLKERPIGAAVAIDARAKKEKADKVDAEDAEETVEESTEKVEESEEKAAAEVAEEN